MATPQMLIDALLKNVMTKTETQYIGLLRALADTGQDYVVTQVLKEELPDAESAESGSHSEHSSLDLRRRRKLALRQEAGRMAAAANRALRIKMGKSGAQAASRKSIKSGKEACQRKLWNQDEDDAIVSLVQKYGTKRWTYIAQMLKDDYHIGGRTGK